MENLQLVLLILGAIAIIAVLVHGFWSIRKQQPKSLKEASKTGRYRDKKSRDADGFDADGISEVRVSKAKPIVSPSRSGTHRKKCNLGFKGRHHQVIKPVKAVPVQGSVNVNSPDVADLNTANPNVINPNRVNQPAEQQVDIEHLTETPGVSEPLLSDKIVKDMPLSGRYVDVKAPQDALLFGKLDDDEVEAQEVDLSHGASINQQPAETQTANSYADTRQEQHTNLAEPQDVLVLHVTAKEHEEFNGAELLPCLLTLNFKFGDMNIFHRHQDNAGKGKVLFSLANMVKPGVFNPDNMEQFCTQGMVLFMTLPCHGDALMNFSIMLNCAHQIADDLGGQVLDGGRDIWLESTKQMYLQRINKQMPLSA
ncbi:cell division protein ZipA [Shewanella surugensis]|uniref:Cell division protein ZipA n=1 Tax=Shewanella surugensis TaxID=212020 RepID=A0ABT0LH90_9GAMM|nr:cell division protein ZipA [Shewanella surugensis]MCL1127081.1 cell division protein ZipA [Shewanella surugensis]